MAVNTFASNFSADSSTYIAKKLLMLALKSLVLFQLCDKDKLPKNNSRTLQYSRYERVDLPQNTLTEGVTPGDTTMAVSTVTAVMDQWGAVIPISDVAIDSVKHPVLQEAISLASIQAQETVDREIAKTLLTGTNIFYPGAVVSRATLVAGSKIDSAALGKITANLRTDGAQPREGGDYVGAVHPMGEEDMIEDVKFIEAHRYGMVKKLMTQEAGTWKGVRWVRSNTLPFISLLAGASAVAGAGAATTGSLTPATTYYFKVAVVDKATGHETWISAEFNATTNGAGVGSDSIDVTIPALPANATANSLFRVYAGTASGGSLFVFSNDQAASSLEVVTSIPTSGDVAQATPPASPLTVYHAWIFGRQGVICANLNQIRAYLTPAVPSDSDPLVQRRKVGWKTDFKTVISNDNFLARLEHTTTNGNLN